MHIFGKHIYIATAMRAVHRMHMAEPKFNARIYFHHKHRVVSVAARVRLENAPGHT